MSVTFAKGKLTSDDHFLQRTQKFNTLTSTTAFITMSRKIRTLGSLEAGQSTGFIHEPGASPALAIQSHISIDVKMTTHHELSLSTQVLTSTENAKYCTKSRNIQASLSSSCVSLAAPFTILFYGCGFRPHEDCSFISYLGLCPPVPTSSVSDSTFQTLLCF